MGRVDTIRFTKTRPGLSAAVRTLDRKAQLRGGAPGHGCRTTEGRYLITEAVDLEDYREIYGDIGNTNNIASLLRYPEECRQSDHDHAQGAAGIYRRERDGRDRGG